MFNLRYLPLLLLLLTPIPIAAQTTTDQLAYTVNVDGTTRLMLYDPLTKQSHVVVKNLDSNRFAFQSNGLLAYSSKNEHDVELYLLDTHVPNAVPINISQTATANDYPLAWSPDGRYLAFYSRTSISDTIKVWNGETTINITPNDVNVTSHTFYEGELSWSNDDRLAFTARNPTGTYTSEIYLWDGIKTSTVSQNPKGDNRGPEWSPDGRLGFISDRNGDYDILIWDGRSFKDGLPNASTFTNAAPQLTQYFSFPRWGKNGQLEFLGWASNDTQARIYIWDGQTASSQNRYMRADGALLDWSPNGSWAVVTKSPFDPIRPFLNLVDTNNQTILNVKGRYDAWSADSMIAFCAFDSSRWVLSVWDNTTITEIVKNQGDMSAAWLSGSTLFCSNG